MSATIVRLILFVCLYICMYVCMGRYLRVDTANGNVIEKHNQILNVRVECKSYVIPLNRIDLIENKRFM